MLASFWDQLLYKYWMIDQFSELDSDILSILKLKMVGVGKIRKFTPPPLDDIEKLSGHIIKHDNIIIKIELVRDFVKRQNDTFEIDYNIGKIYYTYCYEFGADWMNSGSRYIMLDIDIKQSKVTFDQIEIDDTKKLYPYRDVKFINYPNAKHITFY